MAKQDVELQFRLIDGVTKSLTQIQKGVTGLGASIISVNQAAELTGKVFSGIGRAADAFGGAITGAGDFQDALAALQAVTGASAEEFDRLKAAAIEASERTKFSSIEAAQGLTELARAGLNATDAIATLNPVLALAQGQQLDVARASEFVTITLTQFGLAAQDAGKVADVLASAADKSQLNVEQLGNSLGYAAPLARQLGLTLEETTGIIGKLADEGFRGERSGTALRNVFSSLSNPASKFSKALDDAGISTRDFNEVIDFLGTGTEGAKNALIAIDAEARPAILALANKGSGAIRSLTAELQNAQGAAQRTSDILGQTFNQSLARLQNSIENTRNAFIEPVLGPFGEELDRLAQTFSNFAQTEDFATLRDALANIAIDGAKYIGDLVASFNFADAEAAVLRFVADAKQAYGELKEAVEVLVNFLRDSRDAIVSAYESYTNLRDSLREYADASNFAGKASEGFGKNLENLGNRSGKTAEAIAEAKRRVAELSRESDKSADSSKFAGLSAEEFARKLEELSKYGVTAADGIGATSKELAAVAPAAKGAASGLAGISSSADQSAQSVYQLERQLRSVREELNKAPVGSPEFNELGKQVAILEEKLRKAKQATDEATQSTDKQTESVKRLKQELRDLGNEQEQVDEGNKRVASSNSQVSESFGNINGQASETAISLGNLSEAFVRQALEAAGAAGSIRGYVDTLNAYFEQGRQQEEAILRAIDVIDRQNAALSDEDRIRRQLIQQYGESSTLIEVLLKKKLELLRANKANNDESQREIDLEKEKNAGIAGGLGTGNQAQQASAATGNRNGGGSAANRGESAPISITINQNGATPETIRELTPLIERELIRLGALRR